MERRELLGSSQELLQSAGENRSVAMINADAIRKNLCQAFCTSIAVNPVPTGFAVSTIFSDRSGDPIGFYVIDDADGFRIEDDGEYLARLIGSGIPIDQGQRGQLLEAILDQANAFWDQDTYEIKSPPFRADELGERLTSFLSALIRVRDLELLTREVVRSTFREDAIAALEKRYAPVADLEENRPIDRTLSEFPVDLVIRPKKKNNVKTGAMYFATSSDRLNEALLLQIEIEKHGRSDVKIFAMIEDAQMQNISKKRFQRAQNRSLAMPIFRGDEDAAVARVGRDLALPAAA